MLDEALDKFLKRSGVFTENFRTELLAMVHDEIYKSKQILHAAGQIESNLFLIKDGFARSYYYDRNGDEHTVRFWTAGELIFSHEGYYKVPSFYYTEFMEMSNAISMSYADLMDLHKRFPETASLVRHALLKYRKEEYDRQNILTMPAVDRYRRLFEHNHLIFQKSPAKYIASYLHMSRETLARLMGRH